MLFGKQRNLRRLAVKDNLQRRIVHRAENQRDGRFAAGHARIASFDRIVARTQVDFGMTQHKPGKKIRREKAEQPPRHADLGLRVAVAGGFDHLRANRLGLAQIGRGHLFQRASGRAQANARPLAHEKRSAQLVFKLIHAFDQARHGNEQFFGCGGKASRPRDFKKKTNLFRVHTFSAHISVTRCLLTDSGLRLLSCFVSRFSLSCSFLRRSCGRTRS